jgi:hypothetical protein
MTGRCLCGAVAYDVRGPVRDVVLCHCEECRRWTGNAGAFAAARRSELVLLEERGRRWAASPASDRGARRGFCGECGSSLFWEPTEGDTVAVAAGTLDPPTGLRVAGHWYARQAGDWYVLPDDGLPRDDRSATALPGRLHAEAG